MCDNPFIAHVFFCARGKGTRRHRVLEQTRIARTDARKSRNHRTIRLFRGVVTIMQQIDCNPQFGLSACREMVCPERAAELFLFQFGNLVREPRHFSACGITMHDAFLRRADQSWLGFSHGAERAATIARSDRLFDLADRGAHARAPGLIDDGPARGLTGGFLCGFCIRHTCWTQEIVKERRL
jgi:hypothetical protein